MSGPKPQLDFALVYPSSKQFLTEIKTLSNAIQAQNSVLLQILIEITSHRENVEDVKKEYEAKLVYMQNEFNKALEQFGVQLGEDDNNG